MIKISVLEYDGYKVTHNGVDKTTTIERKVGNVTTTTTLGWFEEGSVIDLIATFKIRDKKMLDYAHKLGLKY